MAPAAITDAFRRAREKTIMTLFRYAVFYQTLPASLAICAELLHGRALYRQDAAKVARYVRALYAFECGVTD